MIFHSSISKNHFRLALLLRFKRIKHIDNIAHFPNDLPLNGKKYAEGDFDDLVDLEVDVRSTPRPVCRTARRDQNLNGCFTKKTTVVVIGR